MSSGASECVERVNSERVKLAGSNSRGTLRRTIEEGAPLPPTRRPWPAEVRNPLKMLKGLGSKGKEIWKKK